MAIVCRKCQYVMTKMEILGFCAGKLSDFVKNDLVPLLQKRSYLENSLMGLLNGMEIRCTKCFSYQGWDIINDESINQFIDDDIDLNLLLEVDNKEDVIKK